MSYNKAYLKYLKNYAEQEAQIVNSLFITQKTTYQFVLNIPVFDEDSCFLEQIFEKQKINTPLLVIIVFNVPDISKQEAIAKKHINSYEKSSLSTQKLFYEFKEKFKQISQISNLSLHQYSKNIDLLIIDRCTEFKIPYKQGVGLARKICNDCSCVLMHENHVKNKLLFNTDADVCLPRNYFLSVTQTQKTSAYIYSFEHIAFKQEDWRFLENTRHYQDSLCHYVNSLEKAGSPYAFHTIGSTLVVDAKYYIVVRGFPKKNAGEDFYLLNKLKKHGEIKKIDSNPILLSCRNSHRTPFGTGASVSNMNNNPGKGIYYHPECFRFLELFLKYAKQKILNANEKTFEQAGWSSKDIDIFEAILAHFGKFLTDYIAFDSNIELKRFHQRFDALQTLKFIHYLRDNYFPSVSKEWLSLETARV